MAIDYFRVSSRNPAAFCSNTERPMTRRYHLAGVKEDLYNPRLPSFRRMDMDSVLCKLPHEHSRLSSPCNAEDFKSLHPARRIESQKVYTTTRKKSMSPSMYEYSTCTAPAPVPLQDFYKRKSSKFENYIRPVVNVSVKNSKREEPGARGAKGHITPMIDNNRGRGSSNNRIALYAWR